MPHDDTVLAPPPRSVPLTLRLRILAGGSVAQFGWLFFGFGLIFVWAFEVPYSLYTSVGFLGELHQARGEAVGWDETSFSINDETVYLTDFVFQADDGLEYSGTSYATGDYWEEGTEVTVEYRATDPGLSRVAGMRASPAGKMTLFILLFPGVGIGMAGAGLLRGLLAVRLLHNGRLAQARLVSKEATSTRINDQTVYKLTFEFVDERGATHSATARTHATEELEDEEWERLVYDPRRPSRAVLFDSLPASPEIDGDGRFRSSEGGFGLALLVLFLPTVTVVGHGLYALWAYIL